MYKFPGSASFFDNFALNFLYSNTRNISILQKLNLIKDARTNKEVFLQLFQTVFLSQKI
jgi:hypothetical protein